MVSKDKILNKQTFSALIKRFTISTSLPLQPQFNMLWICGEDL